LDDVFGREGTIPPAQIERDVPKLNTFIIHPRLFFYPSESTTIIVGYTGTFEKRKGGDVLVLEGKQNSSHQYFEENKTKKSMFSC